MFRIITKIVGISGGSSKMPLRRVDGRYRHGGSDALITCTSICLRRPNEYTNEAARHSIICLRRLSSNRVVCRRDSSSIESTMFCRAPLFAWSPRRRRPNLRPTHQHAAFQRSGELPGESIHGIFLLIFLSQRQHSLVQWPLSVFASGRQSRDGR